MVVTVAKILAALFAKAVRFGFAIRLHLANGPFFVLGNVSSAHWRVSVVFQKNTRSKYCLKFNHHVSFKN